MDMLTANFDLQEARLSDLSAMREMEKVCFPLDEWPLIEQIGVLVLPAIVRIKAVYDGRMVGFVGGDVRRNKGEGWIMTLSVLPAYQRRGIADALLEACEQQMGMPVVKLSVRVSNYGAQALYTKRGYKRQEVWPHYYEGGEDGLVLMKDLPQFYRPDK